MYLKRLELQGYKSFARKTEFVFDRGITAIVGPNGSGKSNIADAVRWAVGETRMSRLRAKVTDDLIFAGSDSRARLGMAQVSMTLDNSDGTLPIRYSEVTVERRAYRDGQNEYLINGTKVRLRDIVELLAGGGLTRDAYTVIGQGLVDTALSLSPQDRRALIDVAAGIRPLQDKRDRALAQLEETRSNLTRVRDIAAEIAPRLRRLEKQAERARQGAQIARELTEALKTWYGYQWHVGQQALRDARARSRAAREALAQRRQTVATLEQRIESRRDREEAQADALNDLREQRAKLRSQYETVRRDLAVRQERITLLQRRQQELTQEIAELQTQRDEQQRQLRETEATLARLNEQCAQLETQTESIRREQADAQQRKAEYQAALKDAQQKAFETASTLTEIRNKLSTLRERREELMRERTSQQNAVADLTTEVDNGQAKLDEARQQVEKHEHALEQLRHDREEWQATLDTATARLEALSDEAGNARRRLERLQARHEALAEMRETGDADAAGAQAVLDARDELGGIIGHVVSLIHAPAEFETAIEAALGPLLHAIVVETWADAQRAIVWLQANQAGRVTFIVSSYHAHLGTMKHENWPSAVGQDGILSHSHFQSRGASKQAEEETRRKEGVSSAVQQMEGVVGLASGVVDCEPEYEPLVQRLLGQTVIVDTLETASKVPPNALSCVTLDGTVVRPSDRITGGAIQTQVLRRERLWRELPAQIQAAEAETDRLEKQRAEVRTLVETVTHRLKETGVKLRQAEAAHTEAQTAVEQAQRDIEALQREIGWRRGVVEQRSEEIQAIEDRIEELQSQLKHTEPIHTDAQSRVTAWQAQLDELEAEMLRDELAEAEKRLAVAQRDRQNLQDRQQNLRTTLTGTHRQIEGKQNQIDTLSQENSELGTRIQALTAEEGRLSEELDALDAEIAPVEEALRTMRREGRNLEREVARARDQLRLAETEVSEVNLEAQRCEDRLTTLRDKIADDLELTAVGEELPQQLALELEGETDVLPVVAEIPDGLEQRVKQLRRQLRQVGAASPEIIAEYEETKKRHDFLTSQIADLEEAADDLRAVASELTEVMTERFTATFEEISEAFEKYFKQLFGGGEAHLSLIEDEEMGSSASSGGSSPGLDIIARPPGKRSQSLALLSGGERALTAVALLFSLLQVSPTPFCVLDEVDAMLDEANIGRFRSALEGLAEETQFIIITHNRGTIHAADTIYGISIGDEGVSQAISLKLDELEPMPA